MHPLERAETQTRSPEWHQGREAELTGAKILACPYPPDGTAAHRRREGWMASSRTAPTRYADGPGGYTSRFEAAAEGTASAGGPATSALVLTARVSLHAAECPGCTGRKVAGAMFCGRCRGVLPPGAFLVLATLSPEEDRARWWQNAWADLRWE